MLSCVQLLGPMDCSLLGSRVHGISQAGILEWAAIFFSKLSCNHWTHVSYLAGGTFTQTTWKAPIYVIPNTMIKHLVYTFLWRKVPWSPTCNSFEKSHGPASTSSPKGLVDFLPYGHFFSKTQSISFKLISSLIFFPYYNSHVLILVISQSWITSRSWAILTLQGETAVSLTGHTQVRSSGSLWFLESRHCRLAFVQQKSIPWGAPICLTLT